MVQNSGKRTLFPQNWSDNDAKEFYDFFLFACVRDKLTKTDTVDLMKCASKIHFRTRRVRHTSRRQVLDHSRPKSNLFFSKVLSLKHIMTYSICCTACARCQFFFFSSLL